MPRPSTLTRRQLVATASAAVSALAAVSLAGCSTMAQDGPPAADAGTSTDAAATAPIDATSADGANGASATGGGRVLLAYFSRAGENYANGGVVPTEVGNTKVMAGFIAEALGADACDEFEIRPVEPYPYSYDETLSIATDEKNNDSRPAIADALPSLADYDAVLVGCPVWWGRPPMIIRTFLEALADQSAGKTVVPFTTHGGSGLGNLDSVIAEEWPDAILSGDALAMSGATIADQRDQVVAWAQGLAL